MVNEILWHFSASENVVTRSVVNPLIGTLKPQSNGQLYSSNAVIGTLAVGGCMGCYIWYSEEEPAQAAAPPSPLLAVSNVSVHPSTTSV